MYVTLDSVADYFGVSRSTILRMVDAGRLPKPVRIGKRAVRFRKSDLEAAETRFLAEVGLPANGISEAIV